VRVLLRPPYRPDKKLAPVEVTAILAREQTPPAGEDPIEWRLLSSLPVESFADSHFVEAPLEGLTRRKRGAVRR
jgi:hypothetical protein